MRIRLVYLTFALSLFAPFTTLAQDITQPHPGSDSIPVTGTLPVIYVNTVDSVPITQKETYIDASMWIDAKGIEGFESVGSEEKPLALGIRGRGNASWLYDKKPYKLKLDKKTALLGMPKSKHFALLNHAPSQEALNEVISFELGKRIGMAWTPGTQPVEVILNGFNIGLYYLTETVRVESNRVDIFEQEDENTDESIVSGGWLVEIDNYDDPYQVKIMQDPAGEAFEKGFTHKSPEVLSDIQRQWLINELTTLTNLLYAQDSTDCAWEEMLDIESAAKYYIIAELTGNLDAYIGSTYIYKDLGGKWMFGPLWDFGWTFEETDRQRTFIEQRDEICEICPYTWIEALWKFPSFRNKVAEIWKDFYPEKTLTMEQFITDFVEKTREAYLLNYQKLWSDMPYFDPWILQESRKQSLSSSAKWFDARIKAAGIYDISADSKDSTLLKVVALGNNTFGIEGAEVTRISITDINGRAVDAQLTTPNTFTTDAPAGLYILSAETETGRCLPVKMVVR